ncbi:hypothetical protein PDESU_02817 [Pontiella desulfatans]|uniref:Uncharacterized protein n=1 Tax=Pontiella desulfatans TaxID=2750659 RepID=A0A6C2U2N7_PONDE|nr:hypothetical protein [Pontiella desulfatans]VGO14258.1 hypothetical protein PDESU_02817 [Pontiella desulfatans]
MNSRWLVAATLIASVAGAEKSSPYASLVENSPFLTPAFKARLGKRDTVSMMFAGYTKIGSEWHFALVEKKTGKSTWMKMNVEQDGIRIESFDEKTEQIHLTVGGLGMDLTLVKEK